MDHHIMDHHIRVTGCMLALRNALGGQAIDDTVSGHVLLMQGVTFSLRSRIVSAAGCGGGQVSRRGCIGSPAGYAGGQPAVVCTGVVLLTSGRLRKVKTRQQSRVTRFPNKSCSCSSVLIGEAFRLERDNNLRN